MLLQILHWGGISPKWCTLTLATEPGRAHCHAREADFGRWCTPTPDTDTHKAYRCARLWRQRSEGPPKIPARVQHWHARQVWLGRQVGGRQCGIQLKYVGQAGIPFKNTWNSVAGVLKSGTPDAKTAENEAGVPKSGTPAALGRQRSAAYRGFRNLKFGLLETL